jgi:hypothetical protein
MRNETGPTSKVIQISTIKTEKVLGSHRKANYCVTTALCEDGSIWQRWKTDYDIEDWICILEAE